MRMNRRSLIALSASGLLASAVPAMASDRLMVVATTGMIADAARQVGGDLVEVRALMGPGVDPHAYRQTRTDIVAMTRADLVLWHGLYLEAQMEEFLLDLAARRPVAAVGEALDKARLLGHEDYQGRFDPHVWMDPELWSSVVLRVRDALGEIAPEQADTFAANADAHLTDAARLSTYSKEALASVPEPARVMQSPHDAFSYLG